MIELTQEEKDKKVSELLEFKEFTDKMHNDLEIIYGGNIFKLRNLTKDNFVFVGVKEKSKPKEMPEVQ